jgi:hypothetical protein
MPEDRLLANMLKVDVSPLAEHFSTMQPNYEGASAFRGVACPIQARILVLQFGPTSLVIIALDAMAVLTPAANALRRRISTETGIPAENVLICCSHSHSAPVLGLRPTFETWTHWVADVLADSVVATWEKRRPARAGVGYGYEYGVCFNTRLPQADRQTKFVRNHIEGRANPRPIDPRVGVLRIDEASGELMGAMVHFAAHPATMINLPEISPDYPGFLAGYVERHRPGATVAFLQGACGDINVNGMFTTLGSAEYNGSLLGKEVDRVLDDITTSERFPIRVLAKEHRLPLEAMPSEEEIAAWEQGCDEYLEHSQQDPTRLWVNGLNMPEYVSAETRTAMVQILRQWCDWIREHRVEIAGIQDVAYELVTARLGDLTVLFHPFEAFVEIGLEVQRLAPHRHTWLVGYANGALA